MDFQALVIGNPGESGDSSYCGGVIRDLELYPEFLRSPLGGSWKSSEITVLTRPDVETVRSELRYLKYADYSVVIFAGHGHTDAATRSTILTLKRGHQIDSLELRRGGSKHTLILDCCRRVEEPRIVTDERMRKAVTASMALDARECRRYFEESLATCDPGLVVMHACRTGETAGDNSAAGGYYSSSLLTAVREWAQTNRANPNYYYSFTVADAHNEATNLVDDLSGGRQHPQIEKPRSERQFPLGIVA